MKAAATVLLLIALGIGLRAFHYLRDPSMWHDEAAIVLNVLERDYGGLLGELSRTQSAPPLYLFLEKTIILLLGDSTLALRLLPFLASCGSLVLLYGIGRRVLPAAAVPFALVLLAFSDRLLWHACEAKPYALDVFAVTAVTYLWCLTTSWPLRRRLVLWTVLAPVVILLVYPGVFLAGALLVVLLPDVWRERRAVSCRLGYGACILGIGLAGLLLVLGPGRAQRASQLAESWEYWRYFFPDWQHPWTIPFWCLRQTFEVVDYGCRPVGGCLVVLAVVGGCLLYRSGQRQLTALLVLPILLAMAAAGTYSYPYGGLRLMAYAGPAIALLVGAAMPATLAWLRARTRLGMALMLLFFLCPVGLAAYRLAVPWTRADCAGAARFVLAHRLPSDAVTANHFEYEYYFRHVASAFRPDFSLADSGGHRLWAIFTSAQPPGERWQLLQNLAADSWYIRQRADFTRTTVILLERPPHRS